MWRGGGRSVTWMDEKGLGPRRGRNRGWERIRQFQRYSGLIGRRNGIAFDEWELGKRPGAFSDLADLGLECWPGDMASGRGDVPGEPGWLPPTLSEGIEGGPAQGGRSWPSPPLIGGLMERTPGAAGEWGDGRGRIRTEPEPGLGEGSRQGLPRWINLHESRRRGGIGTPPAIWRKGPGERNPAVEAD